MAFTPPNESFRGGDRNRGHSTDPFRVDIGHPTGGSNEHLRFDVNQAKMPQPPSAETPGKGDVPVGAGIPGYPVADMRPARR